MLHRLKGNRTRLFGCLLIAMGVIEAALPFLVEVFRLPEWQQIIPPEYRGLWNLALGVAVIYLRQITTTPVGRRE